MRNKAPLALMEQMVMLLVFALAAALCLKGFLWSEQTGRELAARDQALIHVQNAAEQIKHCRGDLERAAQGKGTLESGLWQIGYDEAWQQTTRDPVYLIRGRVNRTDLPLLGSANVWAMEVGGDRLCALKVCWQEVEP